MLNADLIHKRLTWRLILDNELKKMLNKAIFKIKVFIGIEYLYFNKIDLAGDWFSGWIDNNYEELEMFGKFRIYKFVNF